MAESPTQRYGCHCPRDDGGGWAAPILVASVLLAGAAAILWLMFTGRV